jgi:hypothetical protein
MGDLRDGRWAIELVTELLISVDAADVDHQSISQRPMRGALCCGATSKASRSQRDGAGAAHAARAVL